MAKKRSSEILADENREICEEKVKMLTFSTESEKFLGNRGESERRGNASLSQRKWTPLQTANEDEEEEEDDNEEEDDEEG